MNRKTANIRASSLVQDMTHPPKELPPGFEDLPVEDQLDYLQFLWDFVVDRAEGVPVPEWHRRLLQHRLNAHREAPDAGGSWGEVRDRIDRSLREPRE